MTALEWIRQVQQAGGLPNATAQGHARAEGSRLERGGSPFLIVGLGNPGREYAATRHNAGFMVLDALARHLGVPFGRTRHQALLAETRWGPHKVILAKPQTYMNLSGKAVAPLLRYYRVPLAHLMVIYDDMDLPFGTLRLRPQGGHGGHKGMQSIQKALGGRQDFPRLRVGIGRPPGRMDPADYVLRPFTPAEREQWPQVVTRAVEGLRLWLAQGLPAAMNYVNRPTPTPEP